MKIALFDTPAWKETERLAAESGRHWREHFQAETEATLVAKAEMSRTNPRDRGATRRREPCGST